MTKRPAGIAMTLAAFITVAVVFVPHTVNAQQTPAPAYSETTSYEPRVFPTPKKKKEEKPKKEAIANPAVPQMPEGATKPGPIRMPVSVVDSAGKLVAGLQPSDFTVFIDDREQPIESVEVNGGPVNVVLLLDASPSLDSFPGELQQHARELIKQLRPADRVMVCSFGAEFKVLAELTTDRKVLSEAISKLEISDGTSLYEALDELFRERIASFSGSTAVVIFTDGVDTTSQRSSYAKSLVEAEKGDAIVYPVYFHTAQSIGRIPQLTLEQIVKRQFPPRRITLKPDTETQKEIELGRTYLNDLIVLSGGRVIVRKLVGKDKVAITGNLARELHLQYIITLSPPAAAGTAAPQRRKVRVRVNRPNLTVRARGSYIR